MAFDCVWVGVVVPLHSAFFTHITPSIMVSNKTNNDSMAVGHPAASDGRIRDVTPLIGDIPFEINDCAPLVGNGR